MNDRAHQSRPIVVRIYGQDYPVRARGDEEYIKRVAKYVDERMTLIEEQTSANTPTRLAILAALNIADELFQLRLEKERQIQEFEEKARQLAEYLEKNLGV
ncbi:MAG: cell division protein ZapA [Crenarchaeota archaeon]|nr:cell division protein ZapA [Thermoproteota archaeon]